MDNICCICHISNPNSRSEGLCISCDIWCGNLFDYGIMLECDKSGNYSVTSFTYVNPNDDQENPIMPITGSKDDIQNVINIIEQLRDVN